MIKFGNSYGGLLGTLRNVFDTGASILRNRAELAAVELKEEKSRLVTASVLAAVFIFSTVMAVIAVSCMLLFLFWEQRLSVAIWLSVFGVVGAIIAFLILKQRVKHPAPFGETISQFKKDRAWLRGL